MSHIFSHVRRARFRNLFWCCVLCSTHAAWASQTQVHVLEGFESLVEGELDGLTLDASGALRLGPQVTPLATDLSGPVLAGVVEKNGSLYFATSNPGRIWRVAPDNGSPELVVDLQKPLITGLFSSGPAELVALSAPNGGAHFIDLRGKNPPRSVGAPNVKVILAGAVRDGAVYAVGGGEEGKFLRLAPGATSFSELATVKEAYLRSIAFGGNRGGDTWVLGGGNQGIVYRYAKGSLRALVDAAPTEVTALAVDAAGHIFAALVDGEGKLSDGATENDARTESKKTPPAGAQKVKSAEILRIDRTGRVDVMFQSKKHGVYALLLSPDETQLWAGTGGGGGVFQLDATGKRGPSVWVRLKDQGEISSLAHASANGIWMGTAHPAGVHVVTKELRQEGSYLSPALDAKAVAAYGMAYTLQDEGSGSSVQAFLRTGNTATPDETWSSFSNGLVADGAFQAPPARYAQLRFLLRRTGKPSPQFFGARLAYLVENRAPEIGRVEVLAPGWKLEGAQRESNDSRSVTFSKSPFTRYLDQPGNQLPDLKERPSGKQRAMSGWRSVYAWAEDPDEDALRYRFSLGRVGARGQVSDWEVVKDWSEEPFYSDEFSRLPNGQYRVRVDVDDLLSNGPQRFASAERVSPVFRVAHQIPEFLKARARRLKDGYRVSFDVVAALPLAAIRCSPGGEEWVPVDAADGMVDGKRERVDVQIPGSHRFVSVSCEAMDEGGNHARLDFPVTE